jgi:hypothetical protein
MTDQSTNGPVQEAGLEAGVLERGAELSARMLRPQPAAETTPERTAAELRQRLELIREVKRTAMTENVDYGVVPGTEKATLFKPGAEKLALVFKLDVQPSNELIWGPSEHLTVISRATVFHAPTGTRLGYGEGICSSRERNRAYRKQERTCPNCAQPAVIKGKEEFGGGWLCWRKKNGCGAKFPDGDQRIESQEVGEIENPDLPDTWNAVDKMAKKRGYVDAVLSVTGASAIFTQDIGADPSDAEPNGLEHGAVVSGALKQAARQAAIKLCGGDIEQAKALWKKLQGEFDGYMPEAPARTLLLAAEHAAQSTGDHQQASSQTDGLAIGGTRAEEPTSPQHTDKQPQPAAETPPEEPASPQGQGDPNPAPASASEPNTAPPEPNLHGARLRAIANRRGVNDAELANLIRNAVAQGPIPAERARTALPEMLARITEEIGEHTIELVEMFHPPSTNTDAVTDQTTSVDFGALEPPQAA